MTGNHPPFQTVCFEANPDIAGLVVLYTVYIQVFISIFVAFYVAWDRKFKKDEVPTMTMLCQGTLLLSTANAITGIVQLSKSSLNAYHASVILSLGLLLEGPLLRTSTIVSMSASWVKLVEGDWKGARKDFWRFDRGTSSRLEISDAVAHSPLLNGQVLLVRALNAGLTIAILSTISTPECGRSLKGGAGLPVLGAASKICWWIVSAIRLIDVATATASFVEQLPVPVKKSTQHDHQDIHRSNYLKSAVVLTISMAVAADMELLRSHAKSASLISQEKAVWNFGQILPMCVPIAEVIAIFPTIWAK